MRTQTKIMLVDEEQGKFFGEGPCRLLREVERTGSLRAAAFSMGMAYSKALKILKRAEEVLGFALTTRTAGGALGGGSSLTEEGKAWLLRYEAYRDACICENEKLYQKYFGATDSPEKETRVQEPPSVQELPTVQESPVTQEPPSPQASPASPESARIGCIILASGLGRRFGSNKLMAEFRGRPLIGWILQATEGIFDRRIVVTRHASVAAYCREQGAEVIPHDQPHLSETVHTGCNQATEVVLHDLPYLSDTIRIGLEHLGPADSCMFCTGDQPLLSRETVEALVRSSREDPTHIWRVSWEDRQGSPVIFPSRYFEELRQLPEDRGGSAVIKKHPGEVRCVPARDALELMDIDCPDDLAFICERQP